MSESDQSGAGRREVAYRLFAAEYEDADYSYSESDEDRAPNYVITPTGARVNRLFVVGVLTEIEQVSDDVLRGRVVDPTGAFVLYAGQYQPDEQAFLESAQTPTFVAVTGKARTFQPEDSDQVFTSVRPESINEVDADTRDRWNVQAAEQTLDRIGHTATALSMEHSGDELERALTAQGVDEGLAAGIPLALSHYGTTPTYLDALREMAIDAARVVAGERDEVSEVDVSPDESGPVTAADLVSQADVSLAPSSEAGHQQDTTTASESATSVDESPSTTGDSESAATDNAGTSTTTESRSSETVEPGEDGATDEPAQDDVVSETAATETAATTTSQTDDVSTDVSTTAEPTAEADTEDVGDFEPGEFELEDETREQIEDEYGTEFQTGTEVEEPGEADIETPDIDEAEPATDTEPSADADSTDTEPTVETTESEPATESEEEVTEAEETTEDAGDTEDESESETTEQPEDMQAAVVELMQELDDGSGADREALLVEMADRYGVGEDETEDAIQQALMDGECYEPDDTTLKAI
jgi:RPA family protein